jgi:hypothetical protein
MEEIASRLRRRLGGAERDQRCQECEMFWCHFRFASPLSSLCPDHASTARRAEALSREIETR